MNLKMTHLFLLFLITITVGLSSSCVNDSYELKEEQDLKTLSFFLQAPLSTRAEYAENDLLTPNNLGIYVFSTEEGIPLKLANIATGDKLNVTLVSGNSSTNSKYKLEFKIPASLKGKLIGTILANGTFNSNYAPKLGDTYQDFENGLIHQLTNKIEHNQVIPMSGTFLFDTEALNLDSDIKMTRAFSRVRFNINAGNETQKKYKFKSIDEIQLFRTHDRYAILPKFKINENGQIAYELTIPEGSLYLLDNATTTSTPDVTVADQYPLRYKYVNGTQNTDLNEILLPEEFLDKNGARDRVVTAIMGVTLDAPEITGTRYYRVDFSSYDEQGKPIDFQSLQRNKLYGINLSGANTSGAGEPEEALTEESVLHVGFQEWDEYDIAGKNINGQYYFSLKAGDVSMGHLKTASIELSYDTDISDAEVKKNSVIKWFSKDGIELSESKYFNLNPDFANKTLKVTPKNENNTKDDWTEFLEVKIFNHLFKISVTQLHKPADYKLHNTDWRVNGVYVKGQDNDDYENNYVEVKLYAEKKELINNLSYHIKSSVVDGIYIDQKGEFGSVLSEEDTNGATIYYKIAKLKVRGISTEAKDKALVLESDGILPSYLKVVIPFAYTPKTILGFFTPGDPERLSNNDGFKKLVANQNGKNPNFGLLPTSSVKSEDIKYIERYDSFTDASLYAERADVIIIGRELTRNEAIELHKYSLNRTIPTSRGGKTAIIVMNGDESIYPLLLANRAFKFQDNASSNITPESTSLRYGPMKNALTFNTIDGLSPQAIGHYRYFVPFYDWDKISNGSFGKVGTLFPKLSKDGIGIKGLKYDKAIKYTGILPFAIKARDSEKLDWAYSIFRLTELPVLWIGDEKFINSPDEWKFNSSGKIEQIVNNTLYSCDSEKYINMGMAYNGFVFANILDWAFHTSEYGNK